jgi:hypothetical protein
MIGTLPWDDIATATCRAIVAYTDKLCGGKRNTHIKLNNLTNFVYHNPDPSYGHYTDMPWHQIKTRLGHSMTKVMGWEKYSQRVYVVGWGEVERRCEVKQNAI